MIRDAPDNRWFFFSRRGRLTKAIRVISDAPDNRGYFQQRGRVAKVCRCMITDVLHNRLFSFSREQG